MGPLEKRRIEKKAPPISFNVRRGLRVGAWWAACMAAHGGSVEFVGPVEVHEATWGGPMKPPEATPMGAGGCLSGRSPAALVDLGDQDDLEGFGTKSRLI